ncbi:hypothetical protein V6N13_065646 [Hibiscus sabdariffa]
MYLMSCTRPDIAFTISSLSRFTSNPSENHWKAIVRVLRYLRYTRDYGLHYSRDPAILEGYSDASWISDIQDTKGTSGYAFTLGGGVVSWKSSRQTIITRSTIESEVVALDKTGEEAEWLRQFLEDIPEWPKLVPTFSQTLAEPGDVQGHMNITMRTKLVPERRDQSESLWLREAAAVDSQSRPVHNQSKEGNYSNAATFTPFFPARAASKGLSNDCRPGFHANHNLGGLSPGPIIGCAEINDNSAMDISMVTNEENCHMEQLEGLKRPRVHSHSPGVSAFSDSSGASNPISTDLSIQVRRPQ